jgi:17beta-estradiol 17-dehydrogenase / very-long-chain 3-oxoacyl-CoA reductase
VSRGFHVILQGRNKQKLETAKAKLEGEHLGAKIKDLVIDAQTGSIRDLEKEIVSIQHLNITILVNNVGGVPLGMTRYFKPLTEYSFDEIDGLIDLNARFLARITRLVLPFLPRKSPSLIMNVSSGADIGMPWMVMYSGAKGFVTSFSKALAREMKMEGLPVEVVALTLGDVYSGTNTTPLSWKTPSSRVFARATLDRIGRAAGDIPHVLTPYWAHALTLGSFDYLPERVRQSVLDEELRAKGRWFDKVE